MYYHVVYWVQSKNESNQYVRKLHTKKITKAKIDAINLLNNNPDISVASTYKESIIETEFEVRKSSSFFTFFY